MNVVMNQVLHEQEYSICQLMDISNMIMVFRNLIIYSSKKMFSETFITYLYCLQYYLKLSLNEQKIGIFGYHYYHNDLKMKGSRISWILNVPCCLSLVDLVFFHSLLQHLFGCVVSALLKYGERCSCCWYRLC